MERGSVDFNSVVMMLQYTTKENLLKEGSYRHLFFILELVEVAVLNDLDTVSLWTFISLLL